MRPSVLAPFCLAIACVRAPADPVVQPQAVASDDPEPPIDGIEGDEPPAATGGALPPAGGARDAFLAEIERELAAMRSSTYVHRTHVDETTGTFEYDCSGFLDYALARSVPDALAAVQALAPRRPRARDFVAFFLGIPGGSSRGRWERVPRVQDLVRGDVVVWLKPADSRSTNTGHTMIVRGPVVPDPEQPGAFIVPIVDSTAKPHVPGDTRSDARRTGLGQGEIVLVADASGAPVRFRWSRGKKSREKETTIALGRLR